MGFKGVSHTLSVAPAEVPSPKLAVSVKLAPLLNAVRFRSDANTKNAPPSATPKLTVPFPALSRAPSRLVEAPRAQCAVAGSVSQTPPPVRSSSRVTVRAKLPAWTVTRKVPSSAPSALKAELLWPSLSRSVPRNARLSVGGGACTLKPPVRTTDMATALESVTSKVSVGAVSSNARAREKQGCEADVVQPNVTPVTD